MNRVLVAGIAKKVTRFCVDRTSSAALRTLTDYVGVDILPFAPKLGEAVRFIGVEATSFVVAKAVGEVVDDAIDEAADFIAEVCVSFKRTIEESRS